MSRRPRLVHEGSPIINDQHNSSNEASMKSQSQYGGAQETMISHNDTINTTTTSKSYLASIAAKYNNGSTTTTTSKSYKLQTKLVVGQEMGEDSLHIDEIDMSMDEDEHDDNNNVFTSSHASNDNAMHKQQYNEQQSYDVYNNAHNNNFDESAPPDCPSIYQMPSPSTSPLVVIDGANVAYNYSESLHPVLGGSQRRQPDPKGITLAIEYFLKNNCRVQAVVPISWYQLKPRPADTYHLQNRTRGDADAKMVTEEVEELRNLRQRGFLVACPPGDDDDAYCIALARREDDRRLAEQQCDNNMQQHDTTMGGMMDEDDRLPASVLGGYVLSNDMFHDAIRRDEKQQQQFTPHDLPLNGRPSSLRSWMKSNRISFSFANVGATLHGDIQLDFLPNPRNNLIAAIDTTNRLKL